MARIPSIPSIPSIASSTPPLKLVAVCGSPTSPSRTLALTHALVDALASRLRLEVHVLALSDIARDVGQALGRNELSPAAEQQLRHIETADVLIAATPVFRGGLPGHFKHLFDLIDTEALVDVPVLLAATGGSQRHALVLEQQLRPLFNFLQALTLPIGVYGVSSDFADYRVNDAALRQRIHLAVERAAALLSQLQPRSLALQVQTQVQAQAHTPIAQAA